MADYVADILQRICRLSIEEEDREEPMVSDADHHEDFQVTTATGDCFSGKQKRLEIRVIYALGILLYIIHGH